MRTAIALIALLAAGATIATARAESWPTFDHDAARSGSAHGDPAFTPGTVSHLKQSWQISLGAVADSSPIFLANEHVRGIARGMLYITDKDGTTYGIDAFTGHVIWRFETHGPKITTSVPVADASGMWIYAPGVDGYVHKLNALDGKESRSNGFPVRITQMPQTEKNASSLTLANGYLYAATSGYIGDAPPYDGHVVAIDLSNGSTHVFDSLCSNDRSLPTATSCSGKRSGIWSRGGVAVDPDPSMSGRIYVATGNGPFDADHGGDDYGDSVISLSKNASKILGSFTPKSYDALENDDLDLGSSSPALLPRQTKSHTPLMLVQGGKDQHLYLLDRSHLGGVGGELQQLDLGARLFATPAIWQAGNQRTYAIVGLPDAVRAYRVETDAHGKSRLVQAWSADPGASPEGTSPAVNNGVVFVATSGAVVGLDASSGKQLWKGTIGDVHWQSPIAVDGAVYCADQDGHLTAFRLH